MRPTDNWRSVFLLPQSSKKKNKKSTKDTPSPPLPPLPPPPRKISLSKPSPPPQTQNPPRRHTMSGPSPRTTLPVQSPDSADISPKTPLQPKDKSKADYFSLESQKKEEDAKGGDAGALSRSFSAESSRTESFAGRHRGSSIGSLTFAPVRNLSLPQGAKRTTDKERIRASSPAHDSSSSRLATWNE
ncbi:hypothetical protein K456DRAFT_802605 [Colletotrichum gloeosporioides 23]|nr:hypothetical protein K456DRAFT_802605 [Colletotrichum gloeosporioides 23]